MDGVLAEARQRGSADGHDARQFVGGVRAVIPEVRVRMRASRRPGILVGNVDQPCLGGSRKDLVELHGLDCTGRELPIAVVDRHLVPLTDVDRVGLRQVRRSALIQGNPRMRVVHDRDRLRRRMRIGTGGKIMCETQSVSGLVRRELAQAREHHFLHGIFVRLEAAAADVG